MSKAIEDIAAERSRQIGAEGFFIEGDDRYTNGELAAAAACYALEASAHDAVRGPRPAEWPWSPEWWKPSSRRRELIKAGALIVAEIERLDRAEAKA